MKDLELTILLPCLNEERTIEKCILEAKRFLDDFKINGEILVADNGSCDNSLKIIKNLKVRYIKVKEKGYGNVLRKGFKNSLGKYIIMADSDFSYDLYNLKDFLDKLREGYDLVMGNRFKGGIQKGAMPFLNRYIGNPLLSFLGRLCFPCPIRDFHSGLRAFRKDKIVNLKLKSEGMELASEIVIKSVINNYKMTEIPIILRKNNINRIPHLKPFKDGLRHLKLIYKLKRDTKLN